jgi:hypothetical protein
LSKGAIFSAGEHCLRAFEPLACCLNHFIIGINMFCTRNHIYKREARRLGDLMMSKPLKAMNFVVVLILCLPVSQIGKPSYHQTQLEFQ